jgi:putative phosphonate metabolism protein
MNNPDARVAVYYAPDRHDPLFAASTAWLGRDPETNAVAAQPEIAEIAAITEEPRLYGFHATLKPPMRLAPGSGWDEFLTSAAALAGSLKAFDLPPLAVMDLHGFLALRETRPSPELQALADACVERLDALRAPPTPNELARRRRAPLTTEQDAMLVRWGYPYVFETWFFHMTLTRRLSPEEKALYRPKAEAHFAQAIATPRRVTGICLFVQPNPGAPFTIAQRLPLLG